jgi:MoxR-like ATPase
MVLATENPIEMEGTYPLPEAQLDRFLLKVIVPAPDEAELCEIVQRTTGLPGAPPKAVLAREDLLGLRRLCREVFVATPVIRYASKLVAATSPDSAAAPDLVRRGVRYGAGVRGAQALVLAAKAAALLEGRGQMALEDVQSVSLPALRHRIIRSFEGEAEGITTDNVIREVLRATPARPEHVERALEES